MVNIEGCGVRVLGIEEVQSRTGLDKDEMDLEIYEGIFPAQLSLGAIEVGWLESEIEEWICIQLLIASWRKECAWDERDYRAIRKSTGSLDTRLWTINDVQGEYGTICQYKIRKMYEYEQ